MKRTSRRNLKLTLILLFIPVVTGAAILGYVFTDSYRQDLGQVGATRLETQNWQIAQQAFKEHEPEYGTKYAYYRLKERQDLAAVSKHFSVPMQKLAEMNPGTMVAGTTIKVTPLEGGLTPEKPNGLIYGARIIEEGQTVRVKQDFKNEQAITDIPELANLLRRFNVFEQTGPKSYRLLRPLSLEDDIRVDITKDTVDLLELKSAPYDITCLCAENIEMLIKDTKITSYDPATTAVDTNPNDERSFIRALKSARVDIINSHISYLGNGIMPGSTSPLQREGGTYGVSWRIPDDMLGVDIVTGWVEGTTFDHNYYGSYSFGASGMVWRGNHYVMNDVYGLDPHDDSNNALIENNVFEHNGKHGFIVSKRCNYNVIRNNISFSNKLHGYMLHQDSVYNIIENNIAYDNVDNFAIYASDYNMVRDNRSYNARGSHVRINENSQNNYVINNIFYGGKRGVYVYGNSKNTYVSANNLQSLDEILTTNQAVNVLFSNNTIARLGYKLSAQDRIIFGPNTVNKESPIVPSGVGPIKQGSDTAGDKKTSGNDV